MKFFGEKDGLHAGTLKIAGEGVEFAVSIGNMPFHDGRNDDTSALDADLQAAQGAGHPLQGIIGGIQMVDNLRMRTFVKTAGTQQQMQGAQCVGGVGQPGISGTDALLTRDGIRERRGLVRLRPARVVLINENCGSKNQETVPNCKSQKPNWSKGFATPPKAGAPQGGYTGYRPMAVQPHG